MHPLGSTWKRLFIRKRAERPSRQQSRNRQHIYQTKRQFSSHKHGASISGSSHAGPYQPHNPNGLTIQHYRGKIASGEITPDPKQEETMKRLQDVGEEFLEYVHRLDAAPLQEKDNSLVGNFLSKVGWKQEQKPEQHEAPLGFYMYGDVGCGKTMLMDLFLDSLPVKHKKRVHFNSFMQSFHDAIHKWRTSPSVKDQKQSDALDFITDSIINEGRLLCFDEFQVTNIADAMMLGRLFTMLWNKGAVVVCTSNRPPDDLYKGGLQRDLFLPFIAELKHRCKVHYINSETDYRLIGERAGHVYIEGSIKEPGTSAALQDVWDRLTEHRPGESAELNIRGRKLFVPQTTKGIALFQFSDLCEKALGPADFTLIAQTFHTVLIDKIPKLSLSQANEVRRFITLIDELYEHHVKLICTAEVPAQELFLSKLDKNSADHVSAEEEIFAFSRTVSRLMEMQTSDYLQSKHTPHPHQRHGHRKDKDPSHQQ